MEITVEKNILTIKIDEATRQELLSMEFFGLSQLDGEEYYNAKDEFEKKIEEELEILTCNSEFSYCQDVSYFGHMSEAEAFYIPTEDGDDAEILFFNKKYMLVDWRVELVKDGKYEFHLG